jgi:hypothetical protein
MCAVSACGASQQQQLKLEQDKEQCYWTTHSDQESKECMQAKGWKQGLLK